MPDGGGRPVREGEMTTRLILIFWTFLCYNGYIVQAVNGWFRVTPAQAWRMGQIAARARERRWTKSSQL